MKKTNEKDIYLKENKREREREREGERERGQHFKGPTHVLGHTFDVVITRDTDKIVSNIVKDPGLSDATRKVSKDHFSVTCKTCAYSKKLLLLDNFAPSMLILLKVN